MFFNINTVNPLELPSIKLGSLHPDRKFKGVFFIASQTGDIHFIGVAKREISNTLGWLASSNKGREVLSFCRANKISTLYYLFLKGTDAEILEISNKLTLRFRPSLNEISTASRAKTFNRSNAPIDLVDRASQPKNTLELEVCEVINFITPDLKWLYLGKWKFKRQELEQFGYTLKKGSLIRVRVKRIIGTADRVKVIERIDDELRIQSDMRIKPAWKKLPWLEPAIDAIYKERDRLTRETGIPYHVDHIYPVNHPRCCGLTVPWNLRVIPAVENIRKSNRIE